jgi:hypothetical protein
MTPLGPARPPTDAEIKAGAERSWPMIAALFAILGIVFWWSCGSSTYHNYHAARAAVEQFHQRLDRADYDGIYSETSAAFRGAGSREDEIAFFERVHQKMGAPGTMTATGFHVNWQAGYTLVDQSFNTHFAQGQAQESFVWLIDNGHALLQTYRVDAPQLQ